MAMFEMSFRMKRTCRDALRAAGSVVFACTLAACAAGGVEKTPPVATTPQPAIAEADLALVNRVTWGATAASMRQLQSLGRDGYLNEALRSGVDGKVPADAEARIASMTISREPMDQLVFALDQQRRNANDIADEEDKKVARRSYQQTLTRLGNEAATRSLLRALYSDRQLQEQLTWFWMNHFNVFQGKANLRAMIGDFEDRAVRPRVLGRFRDLLGATVRHPAMLRYLDNERNAAGRINENYARELMELHTLGVDGGYTQKDVQELARVLTGLGINQTNRMPKVRADRQAEYVREGLFEFNPNRHDYGAKEFMSEPIRSRGLAEVDEVLDRLSRSPATAHFISRKLAMYFVADDPPPSLVDRMAGVFVKTDGSIADTLRAMFDSPEFAASLGGKFKDPVHFVVSAVRVAYGDKTIVNATPMLGWLNRMGEPLYGRQTPDGYPMNQMAWASPGQMTTRFEIARAIGSGNAQLFKAAETEAPARPAFPQLANALYYQSIEKTLSAPTIGALDQAASPQEWNTFLLASPEFMTR